MSARQRLLHWAIAAAGLLFFVVTGTPGLLAYFFGVTVLHVRHDRARGYSLMDRLLSKRESVLARQWPLFLGATHRRVMSLAGRRPHRLLAIAAIVTMLALAVMFGERVSEAPTATAIASRFGFAVAASTMLWGALFGISRRTPLVFGADGVRVRETFVAYSTVSSFQRRRNGVVIERSSQLPPVFVATSDTDTAGRLVELLTSERARARQQVRQAPGQPLPAPGFRENASQVGWRVRVMDAASDEERRGVLERVAPDELRELLDETADPSLEAELRTQLRNAD